jgi:hypothetical protein
MCDAGCSHEQHFQSCFDVVTEGRGGCGWKGWVGEQSGGHTRGHVAMCSLIMYSSVGKEPVRGRVCALHQWPKRFHACICMFLETHAPEHAPFLPSVTPHPPHAPHTATCVPCVNSQRLPRWGRVLRRVQPAHDNVLLASVVVATRSSAVSRGDGQEVCWESGCNRRV